MFSAKVLAIRFRVRVHLPTIIRWSSTAYQVLTKFLHLITFIDKYLLSLVKGFFLLTPMPDKLAALQISQQVDSWQLAVSLVTPGAASIVGNITAIRSSAEQTIVALLMKYMMQLNRRKSCSLRSSACNLMIQDFHWQISWFCFIETRSILWAAQRAARSIRLPYVYSMCVGEVLARSLPYMEGGKVALCKQRNRRGHGNVCW